MLFRRTHCVAISLVERQIVNEESLQKYSNFQARPMKRLKRDYEVKIIYHSSTTSAHHFIEMMASRPVTAGKDQSLSQLLALAVLVLWPLVPSSQPTLAVLVRFSSSPSFLSSHGSSSCHSSPYSDTRFYI